MSYEKLVEQWNNGWITFAEFLGKFNQMKEGEGMPKESAGKKCCGKCR